MSNSRGMSAKITNLGGIVLSLCVPDKNGKLDDVVLGYDNVQSYLKPKGPYFGAIIGRFANRIEDACFELNGATYRLAKNEKKYHHIHGGNIGFDKVVWKADIINIANSECLQLTYMSKDGEENYPGNLDVKVTYSLTEDNALKIDYFAVSDKDTIINLTNHSYFNLSGHASGDILKHEIKINANAFTAINDYCIPTGEIMEVSGTPFDFTDMKPIGAEISANDRQIMNAQGYDHNWILNKSEDSINKAAEVFDPESERIMEVYTTKPGVQFYTGNNIEDSHNDIGKGGVKYKKRYGLCLETQYFPNSTKHTHFPSPILKAGQEYRHTTIYKFLTV